MDYRALVCLQRMSDWVYQQLVPPQELPTGAQCICQVLPCFAGGFGQSSISKESEGPLYQLRVTLIGYQYGQPVLQLEAVMRSPGHEWEDACALWPCIHSDSAG